MTTRVPCVLMRRDEVINLAEAAHRTGKCEKTIRRLCRAHGLARQTSPRAPLEISAVGLEMSLYGDLEAIELLRAGKRTAPEVLRYLDSLGLPA